MTLGSTLDFKQFFQDSPQKEHYDTFTWTDEGLYETLKSTLCYRSIRIPFTTDNITSTPKTTSGKSLHVEFQVEKPTIKHNPIRNYKLFWSKEHSKGENFTETLQGYLHIRVPLTIVISRQRNNAITKEKLSTKQIVLTFRKFPLLDNQSRFLWGDPGHEVERIPIGLIRYAPAPIVDKALSKKSRQHISRLIVRGDLSSFLKVEIHEFISSKNKSLFLKSLKGSISYDNKKISIQKLIEFLDKDLRSIFFKALGLRSQKTKDKNDQ